jgi:predicted nucleotidyltransferase
MNRKKYYIFIIGDKMNLTVNLNKIINVLKGDNNIVFALVFGSQAYGQANRLSDVDIGIFTKDDLPLLRMGQIVSALEKVGGKEVDLVVLNDIYKRKPNFAFQVISSAKLLFTRDEDLFVNFKKNVFLHYLDAKPLIDMVKAGMNKRIETGAFGERNYA